jgi:hypothetical protein
LTFFAYGTAVPDSDVAEYSAEHVTALWKPTSNLEVKSLTGYLIVHDENSADLDATPLPIAVLAEGSTTKAFSQEFKASGTAGARFHYTGGLFFFDEHDTIDRRCSV